MALAIYRPQTGCYADLIEEAAALWESLAQNHPFIDDNKRAAFAAVYTFLAINGTWLSADVEETYLFVPAFTKPTSSASRDLSRGCGAM